MTEEAGKFRSKVHSISEAAVRIDHLLTEAKEMALKLEETSEVLSKMVDRRENHDS